MTVGLQLLPFELEQKIFQNLNIKNLKVFSKVNRYFNIALKKRIITLSVNKIKHFFKNLTKVTIIKLVMGTEDEEYFDKLTSTQWAQIYYFHYPSEHLEEELCLIFSKLESFYGIERRQSIQKVLDRCGAISTRYKIVNCLRNMKVGEIKTVGW